MSTANGQGPLAGWVLVLLGARTLIGRRGAEGRATMPQSLSPVFELHVSLDPQVGPAYSAVPVCFLTGLRSISLPGDACVVPCEELSARERDGLARVIAAAEELTGKLRAVESGIVPVGKGRVVLK